MGTWIDVGEIAAATDPSMADAVRTSGSETQSAIDGRMQALAPGIIAATPSIGAGAQTAVDAAVANLGVVRRDVVQDMANSWWSDPDCVWDSEMQRIYVTGGTHGGLVRLAWFDLLMGTSDSIILEDQGFLPDDHYTRALLLLSRRPAVSFGAPHDQSTNARIRRGKGSDFDALEPTILVPAGAGNGGASYGSIIGPRSSTYPSSLLFHFRSGSEKTLFVRSEDLGATVTPAMLLHSWEYTVSRADATDVHVLACRHPSVTTPQIRYYRMSKSAGLPVRADGTSVRDAVHSGSLWDTTLQDARPFVDLSLTDLVYTAPTGKTVRVLDMARNGRRILICEYDDKTNMTNGGTYYVLTRQTSGSTNEWSKELLTTSGASYYPPSGYVGGACFNSDGSVLLIREEGGVWTLDHWKRVTGGTWTPGTWSKAKTVYTAPAGIVAMGRPRVPLDCNTSTLVPGVVTFGRYHSYDPADFRRFVADQMAMRYTP